MKAQPWLAFCLGAAHAAVLFSAEPAPPAAGESVFVDTNAPEAAEIRAIGERAITRVGMSLVTEITSTMAKDGPEKAVDVCHLKALPLTGEIIAGMPRVAAVKRTSLKLRNPANAPDDAEKRALEYFQRKLDDGTPPNVLVQRIDQANGQHEWRVYRPVVVLQQCVSCHGPEENQSPALRSALKERYPQDAAVGYKLHDWRGLIRVTVADAPPAGKATAVPPKAGKKR